MPKRRALGRMRCMFERLSKETRIRGGSSDTETNALAVMPCVCSSYSAVRTVTPLAKRPNALRNCLVSIGGFGTDDRGNHLRPFFITTLISLGLIRSGTVQPSRSYSAMHCSAKPLYFADCPN